MLYSNKKYDTVLEQARQYKPVIYVTNCIAALLTNQSHHSHSGPRSRNTGTPVSGKM